MTMKTFDTTEPISATVDIGMGSVRITTDDTGVTSVDVRPSDASNDEDVRAAEQTSVDLDDDRLQIRSPKLRSWLSRSGRSSITS